MASIEITVSPDGKTQVATHGFAGDSCRRASEFVERALGRRLEERLTAEFHQTLPTSIQQTHQS